MSKKIRLLLICVLVVSCLAACGKEPATPTPPSESPVVTTPVETEPVVEPTETPTEAPVDTEIPDDFTHLKLSIPAGRYIVLEHNWEDAKRPIKIQLADGTGDIYDINAADLYMDQGAQYSFMYSYLDIESDASGYLKNWDLIDSMDEQSIRHLKGDEYLYLFYPWVGAEEMGTIEEGRVSALGKVVNYFYSLPTNKNKFELEVENTTSHIITMYAHNDSPIKTEITPIVATLWGDSSVKMTVEVAEGEKGGVYFASIPINRFRRLEKDIFCFSTCEAEGVITNRYIYNDREEPVFVSLQILNKETDELEISNIAVLPDEIYDTSTNLSESFEVQVFYFLEMPEYFFEPAPIPEEHIHTDECLEDLEHLLGSSTEEEHVHSEEEVDHEH